MHYLIALVALLLTLAGCSTPGAYLSKVDGPTFTHATRTQTQPTAYFYRPKSEWADQELEAPGLFIDNKLVGALPSNSFLQLYLEPDTYKIEIRRPLLGTYWTAFADGPMEFTRVSGFVLDVKPETTYYLRYDEEHAPDADVVIPDQGDGPLHLVKADYAHREMAVTHEVQDPEHLASDPDKKRIQRSFWEKVEETLGLIGI